MGWHELSLTSEFDWLLSWVDQRETHSVPQESKLGVGRPL